MFIYDSYRNAESQMITEYAARQNLYARQVAFEVEFLLGHIADELSAEAATPAVAEYGPKCAIAMDRLLAIHENMMRAVTRVDSTGIILYTVPLVESVIGSDISYQDHVALALQTRDVVLSDIFETVQGYSAVALHVPVRGTGGRFLGTLAALIPYQVILSTSFQQIHADTPMHPWVISQSGKVMYCEDSSALGEPASELEASHPGFSEIVEAASGGVKGFMLSTFDPVHGDGEESQEMLTSFYPIRFHDNTWTVILSTPKSAVLSGIAEYRNSWLLGAIIFFAAVLAYLGLRIRSAITSRERERWDTVARDRDLLAASVEQATEAVLITDSDGVVSYVNPATASISDVPAEEFVGVTVDHNFDRETARKFDAVAAAVVEHGCWRGNVDITTNDGREFRLDLNVSPVKDRKGEITNYVIVGRDVTVQSEMEARLRERQKMEAIGQLAGGIAHDFNNLVTAIMGYADLLTRNYPPESGAGRAGEVIKSAAYRASDLTDQLLGFARKGKQQVERVDLSRSVRNVCKLLGRILDMRISVELDLEDDVVIMGDPVQIEQIILNLAVNSKDAMPDGGILSYRVARETLSPGETGQGAGFQPGVYAVLRVRDTGSGIPLEIQDRIFEPFFTTKEEGYGSGMGLATVYGIVANHGGWVDLESTPGEGTQFTICIPPAPDPAPGEESQPESEKPVSGGSSTVMLIDDELVIINTVEAMLRNLGYGVVTAHDGQTAVETYRERGNEIDLILMDLAMPGMDGAECFRRLRQLNPSVKVILSSGYGREGRAQEILDAGAIAFLRKPYSLSDLSSLLRDILG